MLFDPSTSGRNHAGLFQSASSPPHTLSSSLTNPSSFMSASSSWTPPPGRVGNLTPEQQKALDEFRAQIKADGLYVTERHDDATLLRFLRARKFDIKLTKDMFAACEKWRKEYGTNEIFTYGVVSDDIDARSKRLAAGVDGTSRSAQLCTRSTRNTTTR